MIGAVKTIVLPCVEDGGIQVVPYNKCYRINLNGLYISALAVDDIGRCSVSRMMMKKV